MKKLLFAILFILFLNFQAYPDDLDCIIGILYLCNGQKIYVYIPLTLPCNPEGPIFHPFTGDGCIQYYTSKGLRGRACGNVRLEMTNQRAKIKNPWE